MMDSDTASDDLTYDVDAAWKLIRATQKWLVQADKLRTLIRETNEVISNGGSLDDIDSVMAEFPGTRELVSEAQPRTLNGVDPEEAIQQATRDMRALGEMPVVAVLVVLSQQIQKMSESF